MFWIVTDDYYYSSLFTIRVIILIILNDSWQTINHTSKQLLSLKKNLMNIKYKTCRKNIYSSKIYPKLNNNRQFCKTHCKSTDDYDTPAKVVIFCISSKIKVLPKWEAQSKWERFCSCNICTNSHQFCIQCVFYTPQTSDEEYIFMKFELSNKSYIIWQWEIKILFVWRNNTRKTQTF